MEITDAYIDKNIQTLPLDDTAYLFSKPAVARDILEGLETSWDDCISEASFNNNEAAMKKIQTLIGANYGWTSEEEMIKDMANFRRERTKINENNA